MTFTARFSGAMGRPMLASWISATKSGQIVLTFRSIYSSPNAIPGLSLHISRLARHNPQRYGRVGNPETRLCFPPDRTATRAAHVATPRVPSGGVRANRCTPAEQYGQPAPDRAVLGERQCSCDTYDRAGSHFFGFRPTGSGVRVDIAQWVGRPAEQSCAAASSRYSVRGN